jgi:aminoglycoside N3'-acetyltransferase
MISQNRADAKRQVIANQQWQTVKEEDKQNEQLLELSNQILELTRAIHESTILKAQAPSSGNA